MGNQTSRFSTLRLSSISEYLEHANRLRDEWEAGKEQEYLSSPWFRGVPNRAYDLVPSYHRFAQVYPRTTEDDLRDEFVRRAYPLLDRSRPADHWEWYFLMQHYSLPTRLLDWSVSSLVGLFFAVYDGAMLKGDWTKQMDQPPEYNAAVWMMDAEVLNKDTLQSSFTRDEPIPRYDHPSLVARYLNPRPFDPPDWPEKPLAILPAYTNQRLVAQKGTFVLFGKSARPLQRRLDWRVDGEAHLVKFIIPRKKVPEFRGGLINAGITAATLFPELGMLSTDMFHDWCWKSVAGR
jgi:hypothetical protein